MGKLNEFLNRKIIQKDVGEETYLTWKETISYALGRGAQGMSTSMTSSKYINYFLTNVLFKKLSNPMGVAPIFAFSVEFLMRLTTLLWALSLTRPGRKRGKCARISNGPLVCFPCYDSVFHWQRGCSTRVQHYLHDNPVCWPRCYIHCVRHPHGALAFSITPNGIERTKLFGVSSIVRSVVGALPQVFVAAAAWLPYFKSHIAAGYLTSAAVSAIGIIFLTRLTFRNTRERAEHREDVPSVRECFGLLFKNRPLLMLFLGNIFFVVCKIAEQVSFLFCGGSDVRPQV